MALTDVLYDANFSMLSVASFMADNNLMTGTLPTEIGQLTACERLTISGQEIEGSIPSEIGRMQMLRFFRAQFTSLEGGIPPELWTLSNMAALELYNTKLSGTIGTEVGRMFLLQSFKVSHSDLFGTIPTGKSFVCVSFCKMQCIQLIGVSFQRIWSVDDASNVGGGGRWIHWRYS